MLCQFRQGLVPRTCTTSLTWAGQLQHPRLVGSVLRQDARPSLKAGTVVTIGWVMMRLRCRLLKNQKCCKMDTTKIQRAAVHGSASNILDSLTSKNANDEALIGFGENMSLTYFSTGKKNLDLFFDSVPGMSKEQLEIMLTEACVKMQQLL